MTNYAMGKNDYEILYAGRRSFMPEGTQHSNGRQVAVGELYDYIADFLSPLLLNVGFKYLKAKKTFVRKTNIGVDEICICSYDYVHYEFDFHFKKRIDNVQKIITELNYENKFNASNKYKEQSTIWVCYSNIMQNNIEAISYSKLKIELAKIYAFIQVKILPYFEKLNSLDFLNQTFNYPELDKQNHFSYFAKDPYSMLFHSSGLVVAKMINDPNYSTLLTKYLSDCQQNEYIHNCLKVVDNYLQERL
jgi:hypothetical protein